MRIAVFGCGSMGLRHIRNILTLGHSVTAHDIAELPLAAALGLGADPPNALGEDAVVIATPATSHRLQGCPLPHFVEKPLAEDFISAQSAFRCDEGHRPRIQVGYQLRFDPDLIALRDRLRRQVYGRPLFARVDFGQELTTWRPGRDYRQTPTAQRELGGGILLEASHELDLILWVFGKPREIQARTRKISDLDIDVEDAVWALLDYGKFWVELHLDMLRPGYRREIEIVCETGILRWRLNRSQLDSFYLEEMRHFLSCVESGAEPSPNLQDGLAVLDMVERIRTAGREVVPA